MKRLTVGLALLMAVLISVAWWWVQRDLQAPLTMTSTTVLKVPSGAHSGWVLNYLQKENMLDDNLSIKLLLRLRSELTQIKQGTYSLKSGTNVVELFEQLATGNEVQYAVKLIEGLRWQDWQRSLNSNTKLDWMALSLEPSPIEGWNDVSQLEGMLLADTYYVTEGSSVNALIQRAHNALADYLDAQWEVRQTGLPLNNPYEALILASIIEKETAIASERAKIAGVFVNRLRLGMRLQTDPTVIYGIGDAFDGDITRAHLRDYTPYNTYRIHGLPPTPIAMPGKEAIYAALNPLPTDALYFVAKGDGSHQFSETLEQHNQAVRQYQLKGR